MIERILEQEEGIRIVLGGDRKSSHLVPSWQDLDVLQSLNAALSPLKDYTDVLSGEDHVHPVSIEANTFSSIYRSPGGRRE